MNEEEIKAEEEEMQLNAEEAALPQNEIN